jgi:UDP-N-acetylmuramate: L-alanyl-gamma-D-glutamyl-meso-diaminopimelate ligase
MKNADKAFVYYSPKTLEHKKLQGLSPEEVKNAFNSDNITVFTDSNDLVENLKSNNWNNKNLLMMSSGNFDGLDFDELGEELLV